MIETIEHRVHFNGTTYEDVVMKYEFDIKGQLLRSIDPYDRDISVNTYDTRGQLLRTLHMDRGAQTLVADAMNLPVITEDAKGARTLTAYDDLQRPTSVWARDSDSEGDTLRRILSYGDASGLSNPQNENLKGKLYEHFDEAGKLEYPQYDFKGNNLENSRRIIADNAVSAYQKFVVDWENAPTLDSANYVVTQEYDALNRIRKAYYPKDLDSERKEMNPTYNKGGALMALEVDGVNYIENIGFNARGQRLVMTMGNGMMTRYAYNVETFRLVRTRSEKFTVPTGEKYTYDPTGGVQQDLAYTYDLEGTIQTQNDEVPSGSSSEGPGGLLRIFRHDPLRRLVSATGRETSTVYDQPGWDLNLRPYDNTSTNAYTRTYEYDKLGNIQKLVHTADGHANQNFNRDYTYSDPFDNNLLQSFDVQGNSYANSYDVSGNLVKTGSDRNCVWGASGKMVAFKNQAGGGTPSIFTWYFYNCRSPAFSLRKSGVVSGKD